MYIVYAWLLLLLLDGLHCEAQWESDYYTKYLNLTASCPNETCSLSQLESEYQHPLRFADNKDLPILELQLVDSKMRQLPVELLHRLPNLQSFLLHNSTLTAPHSFDLAKMPKLKQMTLQYTSVTSVGEEQFKQLSQLEVLNLGHNFIHSLNYHSFMGLTQLKMLSLQGNEIEHTLDGVFDYLVNLLHLDLSNTLISKINNRTFAKNLKLQTLLLNGNNFDQFEANSLSGLNQLRLLDLSDCQLEELQLKSVNKLMIEGSGLRRLIIDGGVIILKAGSNELTQLQIGDKSSPIELDLHENQLNADTIAAVLDGMWNLQRLDLSKNNIDSLWLKGRAGNYRSLDLLLPSLTHLNLAHNPLVNLPLLMPSRLVKLDISYNHLPTVKAESFSALPNLQRLNLENNRLTQFDYKLLHAQHPNLLELRACDPDMNFMLKLTVYLTDRGVHLPVPCALHRQQSPVVPILQPETEAQTRIVAGIGSIHPYWTLRDILALTTLFVVFIILLMQLYRILEEEGWLRRMHLWLSGRQSANVANNGSRRRRLSEEDSESSNA